MRRLRTAAGAGVAALVLAGLAALAYRAYAPGSFSDRVAAARGRWAVFGDASTWRFLGRGLLLTLELAVASIAASLVLGVLLALARLARHRRMPAPVPAPRALSAATGLLVEIVRSSPLFMLIIYTHVVGPDSAAVAGIVALTLYTSCVLSEIARAGILSLDRGQFEAAESLGLRYFARLRHVVLPQALRRMAPAIVSQLATLVKDTSLVGFIGALELFRRGRALQEFARNPIETFLVLMAIYFVINFALSQLSTRLELRPGRVGRARAPAALGAEDLSLPLPTSAAR